MTTKLDEEFAETAADPIRRHDAMAHLSRRRTWLSCGAGVISLGTIIAIYFSPSLKPADALLIFMCCMMWMQVYKYESDLRLLRVIERLHRDEKTVP